MIINNLQNLILSISLAKLNIIDPAILDAREVENIYGKDNIIEVSVSELMSVSKIRVYLNLVILIFLIKYPISLSKCTKVNILPIAHNGKILSFGMNNQLAKCNEEILSVKKCVKAISSNFCSRIDGKTCAQHLFLGEAAR